MILAIQFFYDVCLSTQSTDDLRLFFCSLLDNSTPSEALARELTRSANNWIIQETIKPSILKISVQERLCNLEPPKFTRSAKLIVLKRLCFAMQYKLTWHTPRGDNKRFDLHEARFILKSLTWYWHDYRRLAKVICFFWDRQVSVALKDLYRPYIFSFRHPQPLMLAMNKFPTAFIFIRALDHLLEKQEDAWRLSRGMCWCK